MKHLNQNEKESIQNIGSVALITSGTTTFIINKLEKKGMIRKVQDRKDKRIFWVKITNSGRKQFQQIFKDHETYLDEFFIRFSKKEKQNFIDNLKGFINTLKNSSELSQ